MSQITESAPSRRSAILFRLLFAAAVVTAVGWLVGEVVDSRGRGIYSLFIPASVILASVLYVLRNERHWARPVHRLEALLGELRAGNAPIEELSKIDGGLVELVPQLQELFKDLRQHKSEMARLNEEISHRVAGRTNALERQIGSLRAQATRDGLTGLYNRRMFDALLPKMVERCVADGLDLSLLMIDVDNFKHLNDTLGHAAGDELLRDIAQLIRSGIRDADAAFRLGGDEYVVILPNLGPDSAGDVARRLIELADALARPINITVQPRLSIGVASVSKLPDKNAMELVYLADKRLYEMKRTRNRPQRKLRASA